MRWVVVERCKGSRQVVRGRGTRGLSCTPLSPCSLSELALWLTLQVRLIAAMLSPLLEAVVSHPSLADPARAAAAAGAIHHTGLVSGSAPTSPSPGPAHSPRPSASSTGGAAGSAAAAAAAGGSGASGQAATAGGVQVLKPLGPVAAAAAALLQLRLLEVFFFLPAAQLWGSSHEQLLQLCCRQLLGVGGARVSPGENLRLASRWGVLRLNREVH